MSKPFIDVKITDNSSEVKSASKVQIERVLETIGLLAEGYAKLNCPVDTGRLRNSITNDVKMDENAVYVGTNVEYAAYVEMGTRYMRPQPYIRPAIELHIDEYKTVAEIGLKS